MLPRQHTGNALLPQWYQLQCITTGVDKKVEFEYLSKDEILQIN